MIRFLSLFAALFLLSAPVLAQEEVAVDKSIEAVNDGDPAVRLELSKKMHEIWPVRQKIEDALDVIAENIKQAERLKFKGALRKSIDFEALEKASVDAMANVFSEKELTKMVDFYGSKEGRSVTYKVDDYQKTLQPLMMKMMDKALLNAKMGAPKSGAQSSPQK